MSCEGQEAEYRKEWPHRTQFRTSRTGSWFITVGRGLDRCVAGAEEHDDRSQDDDCSCHHERDPVAVQVGNDSTARSTRGIATVEGAAQCSQREASSLVRRVDRN